MIIGRRLILCCLLLAAPASSAPTTADPPSLADFEAARLRRDIPAMSRIYDARLMAHVDEHVASVSPVLDTMFGELAIETGRTASALPYLTRAAAAASDRGIADRLLLAAARAYAGKDDVERANAIFARLETSPDEVVRAAAGVGRVGGLLYTDPAAAAARLSALAPSLKSPKARWEVDLLLSRALSLAGDLAAARESLARAWVEAPDAEDPHLAIQRTAADLALEGERSQSIGLALVAKTPAGSIDQSALPPCGPALRPDDTLVVEAARTRVGFSILPVRASRPGVAAAFFAMARAPLAPSAGPLATAELRCRLHPLAIASAPATFPTAFNDWIVGSGGYGLVLVVNEGPRAAVTAAEEMLSRAEAAYGADAVVLAPLLTQVANANLAAATAERNAGYLDRARAATDRLIVLMRARGAPSPAIAEATLQRAHMSSFPTSPAEFSRLSTQWTEDTLASVTTTPAIAAEILKGTERLPVADRLALIDKVIAFDRAKGPARGRSWLREALVARSGALGELGRGAEARAALRASGADPALCALAEEPPTLINSDAFSADDYPPDLVMAALDGSVIVEFALDSAGVPDARLIASSPPRLFDEATRATAAKVRFTPARLHGKSVACGGYMRAIRWQLPTDGDRPVVGPPAGPTS